MEMAVDARTLLQPCLMHDIRSHHDWRNERVQGLTTNLSTDPVLIKPKASLSFYSAPALSWAVVRLRLTPELDPVSYHNL